ncbi:MAG: hypothetical protein ACC628_23125 [Pirellulaceae bacterium]
MMTVAHPDQKTGGGESGVSFFYRLRCFVSLLLGLRRHDFRSAAKFLRVEYGHLPFLSRYWQFLKWTLRQMWSVIPEAMPMLTVAPQVSRTPFWLEEPNPLEDHPWQQNPDTRLPERVYQESGMRVACPAGFSLRAGTWHPAKWVWSLLTVALESENVSLYTRTKMTSVEPQADHYLVRTSRSAIHAQHVLYAVESFLPKMEPRFHNIIEPHQEQLSSGSGAPETMPCDNSITGKFWTTSRRGCNARRWRSSQRANPREAA